RTAPLSEPTGESARPTRAERRPEPRAARRADRRARLLTALSGRPDGTPPWIRELAEGDDAGFFPMGGAAWTVHAGMGTLVAGIRALLLQALHPGAMAGVHDHSRFREDPAARLVGTVRWVVVLTYGSTAQARREVDRVARYHAPVVGSYVDGAGRSRAYSAADADLAAWVHLAFADAFLTCHERWCGPIPHGPDESGADAYVREWATAGRLMGVASPPESAGALRAALQGYVDRGELRHDERVAEVVRFLRRPAFPGAMGWAYRVLFAGAVATLPREFRRLLGVRRAWWPAVTATRVVLWGAEKALSSGEGKRTSEWAGERVTRKGGVAA
ncbi:MAG: DUF2236 domain-containing protein, partial [Actinomycetales bacterium]|nr:DUF2236 domain-containing protein [Actinomycetales bacterium]